MEYQEGDTFRGICHSVHRGVSFLSYFLRGRSPSLASSRGCVCLVLVVSGLKGGYLAWRLVSGRGGGGGGVGGRPIYFPNTRQLVSVAICYCSFQSKIIFYGCYILLQPITTVCRLTLSPPLPSKHGHNTTSEINILT